MKRLMRHIGYADEVNTARDRGERVNVLCGRRVKPLDPEVAARLPSCPRCVIQAKAQDALTFTVYVYRNGLTKEPQQ